MKGLEMTYIQRYAQAFPAVPVEKSVYEEVELRQDIDDVKAELSS